MLKGLILSPEFRKFGGRYRNQVPSDLGACPGIYRKSIALDQLGKIPRSELKLQTGLRGYYMNKKKSDYLCSFWSELVGRQALSEKGFYDFWKEKYSLLLTITMHL